MAREPKVQEDRHEPEPRMCGHALPDLADVERPWEPLVGVPPAADQPE